MKHLEGYKHKRRRSFHLPMILASACLLGVLGSRIIAVSAENVIADIRMLPKLTGETYKNYNVDIIVMDEPRSEGRRGGTTEPAHGKVTLHNAVDPTNPNQYRIMARYNPEKDFVGQDSFLLSTEVTVYNVVVTVKEFPTGSAGSLFRRLGSALLREMGIHPGDYTKEILFPLAGAILVIAGIIGVAIVRESLAGKKTADKYGRRERERHFFNH